MSTSSPSGNDGEWEWEMIPPQSSSSAPLASAPVVSSALEISSTSTNVQDAETESSSDSSHMHSSISQRNPHSFSQVSSSSASSSSAFSPSSVDPESQIPLSSAATAASSSTASTSAATSSSGPVEEKMCRICQSDEDPATMISPCKCRGSMRYVHIECLDRWRKTSANPRSFFQCDQCLFKYQFSRAAVGNALKSSLAKHALTIAVLFLLITLSGYLGKILFPLFDSVPDVEVDEEGNIIPLNVTAVASVSAAQRVWEFLRIDFSHMVLGTLLVGVGGFISLFAAGPVRGGFYWSGGARTSSSAGGGRSTGEMIFWAVIVFIGLVRAGYLIYRKIEDRSERVLLNARDMVVNIQAD